MKTHEWTANGYTFGADKSGVYRLAEDNEGRRWRDYLHDNGSATTIDDIEPFAAAEMLRLVEREKALGGALEEAYWLVHHAWDTSRFGRDKSTEAKELRREMAGVLGRVGMESPAYRGQGVTDYPLPWDHPAERVEDLECRLRDERDRQAEQWARRVTVLTAEIEAWRTQCERIIALATEISATQPRVIYICDERHATTLRDSLKEG